MDENTFKNNMDRKIITKYNQEILQSTLEFDS